MLRFYIWAFTQRWLPQPIRVWACRKGGMIMVKGIERESRT